MTANNPVAILRLVRVHQGARQGAAVLSPRGQW